MIIKTGTRQSLELSNRALYLPMDAEQHTSRDEPVEDTLTFKEAVMANRTTKSIAGVFLAFIVIVLILLAVV